MTGGCYGVLPRLARQVGHRLGQTPIRGPAADRLIPRPQAIATALLCEMNHPSSSGPLSKRGGIARWPRRRSGCGRGYGRPASCSGAQLPNHIRRATASRPRSRRQGSRHPVGDQAHCQPGRCCVQHASHPLPPITEHSQAVLAIGGGSVQHGRNMAGGRDAR